MSVVVQGKKRREELQLPILHFVVADDWLDKLKDSFPVWLKLHTYVDRTDSNREYDRIPMSLEKVWEKLGVSKSKFYRLIKPLWEYGLIDIVEYEASQRNSQKPKNIIVYEYPLHEIMRKYQPLDKLRDWEADYDSISKVTGRTGGRPRNEKPVQKKPILRRTTAKYRFKNETVGLDRFKIETVDRFKTETVTVSKMKPNNVSNKFNNVSNSSINDSNNYSSSSSSVVDLSQKRATKSKKKQQEEEDKKILDIIQNGDNVYSELLHFCEQKNFCNQKRPFLELVKRLIDKEVYLFTYDEMFTAYEKTIEGVQQRTVDIPHLYYPTVLANEIVNSRLSEQRRLEKIQEEQARQEFIPRVAFYNWLEQ